MPQLLVLIHTVPPLVGEFTELCQEVLPGVRLLHVLDEPLLERIRQHGSATPEDDERLADHVRIAEAVGASAVLVTCSTVSFCVDAIRHRFRVPITKIDDAMAAKAVRLGTRISIVATNPTTFEASRRLIEDEAHRIGNPVHIRLRPVAGALEARLRGDDAVHDRLVECAVRGEANEADVVVLAQASMARVLDAMAGAPVPVPVLASPRLALAEVRRALLAGAEQAERATGMAEARL
ncbi:MAG: aspartate/glutamate racemase family protein [Candidatus Limnocylindrales bacterium]|jgi:Asp/Glu/hydantoin racemase